MDAQALSPVAFKAAVAMGAPWFSTFAVRGLDAQGSVPHSLNIGLGGQFASWAGTLLDGSRAIALVAENAEKPRGEARVRLARVGLENVAGWLEGGSRGLGRRRVTRPTATPQVTVAQLQRALRRRRSRSRSSTCVVPASGRAATSTARSMPRSTDSRTHAAGLDPELPTYVVCAGGYRSVMGAEILRELGVRNVDRCRGRHGGMEGPGPSDGRA
jgi:hydroxyacylglutathione hydrolase